MVVSHKLIASNRTHEAIASDAETALSIARVAFARQFQGVFILLRQFNFGMASRRPRMLEDLLIDSFPANSLVASADSIKNKRNLLVRLGAPTRWAWPML